MHNDITARVQVVDTEGNVLRYEEWMDGKEKHEFQDNSVFSWIISILILAAVAGSTIWLWAQLFPAQ